MKTQDKEFVVETIDDLESYIFSMEDATVKLDRDQLEKMQARIKGKYECERENNDLEVTLLVVPITEGKSYN